MTRSVAWYDRGMLATSPRDDEPLGLAAHGRPRPAEEILAEIDQAAHEPILRRLQDRDPGSWLDPDPVPARVVPLRGRGRWSVRPDGVPLFDGALDGVTVRWRRSSRQSRHLYERQARTYCRAPVFPYAAHPDDGRGDLRLDLAYAAAWIGRAPMTARPCIWQHPEAGDCDWRVAPLAWIPIRDWRLHYLCWWSANLIREVQPDVGAIKLVGVKATLALHLCQIGLTSRGQYSHGGPSALAFPLPRWAEEVPQ